MCSSVCRYMVQGISEEISRLESQQKGNDEMKRQIDEVIAYQQSRSVEKELQLKIEQVILLSGVHLVCVAALTCKTLGWIFHNIGPSQGDTGRLLLCVTASAEGAMKVHCCPGQQLIGCSGRPLKALQRA